MRVFVFLVIIIGLAGILFWNDLFNGEDEGTVVSEGEDRTVKVVVPEASPAAAEEERAAPDVKALLGQEKWEEALQAMDKQPGFKDSAQGMAGRGSLAV